MLAALIIGLPLVGAVCWRLSSQYQPFEEAFSDFSDAHQLTDAQLLDRLYASDGSGCELGFHDTLNSQER